MSAHLNITVPIPSVPVIDPATGQTDLAWERFFIALWLRGSVQYNANGAFGGYTDVQLTTHIKLFTATLSGATPASGGGTLKFLRADGTFASAVALAVDDLNGHTIAAVSTLTLHGVGVSGASPDAIGNFCTITGLPGVNASMSGEDVFVTAGDDSPGDGQGSGDLHLAGGASKSGGGGGNARLSGGAGDATGGAPAAVVVVAHDSGSAGVSGGSVFVTTGKGGAGANGGVLNINLGVAGAGGINGNMAVTGTGCFLLVGTGLASTQTVSAQIVGGVLADVINVGSAAASPRIISGSGAPAGTPAVATLYIRTNGSVGAGLYFANAGAGYNPIAGV